MHAILEVETHQEKSGIYRPMENESKYLWEERALLNSEAVLV